MTWLARFIAARPWLVDLIIQVAKRNPYFHLTGYMGRWWLCPRWLLTQDEYGNPVPYAWVPFKIRIHHILRADAGRALHDHPMSFRTFLLRGWYAEENIYGGITYHSAGETLFRNAETFHRITDVPPEGVWTMFCYGKRRNHWGFLEGNRKIPWRTYLQQEKSHEI